MKHRVVFQVEWDDTDPAFTAAWTASRLKALLRDGLDLMRSQKTIDNPTVTSSIVIEFREAP